MQTFKKKHCDMEFRTHEIKSVQKKKSKHAVRFVPKTYIAKVKHEIFLTVVVIQFNGDQLGQIDNTIGVATEHRLFWPVLPVHSYGANT
jgi:hypothetical protein